MCLQHSLNPLTAAMRLAGSLPDGGTPDEGVGIVASARTLLNNRQVLTGLPLQEPGVDLFDATGPSRRLRLWELSGRLHCPIIGVCFSTDDVRTITQRIPEVRAMSDFELHASVVAGCGARSDGSRLFDRELNRRYRLVIQSYAIAATATELLARWRTDVEEGRVAGALWASVTHPLCDAVTEDRIYGDIHLLQHQCAAEIRSSIRLAHVERAELQALRSALGEARTEAVGIAASHRERVQALMAERDQLAVELNASRQARQDILNRDARELDSLTRMNESLLAEVAQLRAKLACLEKKAACEAMAEETADRGWMASAQLAAARPLASVTPAGPAVSSDDALPDVDQLGRRFDGKRVLCVGGIPGSVVSYRNVVEKLGGRFDHHDGGIEQALTRLEPALRGADVVMCQAANVSHGAYWRVKKYCRRTGKPCVYLESPGLQSFLRGVDALTRPIQIDDADSKTDVVTI